MPTLDGGAGISDLTPGSVAPGEVGLDGTTAASVSATDAATAGTGNGSFTSAGLRARDIWDRIVV